MRIGTNGPRGNAINRSTFTAMKSKVKVTQHRKRSQQFLFVGYLENYPSNCKRTWRQLLRHIALYRDSDAKVKDRSHTRLKIDLEA